jgi:hypothetical protein
MSSRLRKAYVAAKFYKLADRWARARHSEAAAACSSVRSDALLMDANKSGRAGARPYRPLREALLTFCVLDQRPRGFPGLHRRHG